MSAAAELVDLQVNGYGGVDFNDDGVTVQQIAAACRHMLRDGVDAALATIITDDLPAMQRRLARLVAAREADADVARVLVGWHVEGPFISPVAGYVGAHPAEAVRPATIDAASRLLDAGAGLVRLVTLAPEQDAGGAVTRHLTDAGAAVAAGHSNASLDELRTAIDNGLSLYTHLGNGCPAVMPRHDNIVQRVLSLADRLWIMFIADGVHVPWFALGNYLRAAGLDRSIVVSDAIAAAGLGPGEYSLRGERVTVDEQLATWSSDRSHLRGAATSLRQARDNLVQHLGLSAREAQQLCSDNPRRVLANLGGRRTL